MNEEFKDEGRPAEELLPTEEHSSQMQSTSAKPRQHQRKSQKGGGETRRNARNNGRTGGNKESVQEELSAENVSNLSDLRSRSVKELKSFALAEGYIGDISESIPKRNLECLIARSLIENGSNIRGEGCLKLGEEIIDEDGKTTGQKEDDLLHFPENSYCPEFGDIRVPSSLVRRHRLRAGDMVSGPLSAPKDNESLLELTTVEMIDDMDTAKIKHRDMFYDLTSINPNKRLVLERKIKDKDKNRTGRIIDFFAPIGKGQRCLIASQPKSGKSTMLQNITHAIEENHPDVELIVLLVAERPEEVTHFKRAVMSEVVASTFDNKARDHVHLAELVIEKAKRKVEMGKDIVIMLDSITRLARAMNSEYPATHRTTKGGVEPKALEQAKRLFGAGRNIEGGGSLTIIATALVGTGVFLDDVLYEEFKGGGNSDICLDRSIADKGKDYFPAIDLKKSSTRHAEELLDERTFLYSVRMNGELKENDHRKREFLNHIENTDKVFGVFNEHDTNQEMIEAFRFKRGPSLLNPRNNQH